MFDVGATVVSSRYGSGEIVEAVETENGLRIQVRFGRGGYTMRPWMYADELDAPAPEAKPRQAGRKADAHADRDRKRKHASTQELLYDVFD